MEANKQSADEIEKESDENPVENPTKIEKFKNIIYKLVMNEEINEKDREIIDSIVEKKDEELYNDEDKNDDEVSGEDEKS